MHPATLLFRVDKARFDEEFHVMAHRCLGNVKDAFHVAGTNKPLKGAATLPGGTQKLQDADTGRITQCLENAVFIAHASYILIDFDMSIYVPGLHAFS